MQANCRYLIISPVRDEERYLELTLQSVIRQTRQPLSWIIVNDNSTDATPEIVRAYAAKHSFITLIDLQRGGTRQPGVAVIRAFERGYEAASRHPHDFIVKLDCDLSFEADYFEKLLDRFAADERLGIASGVYLERDSAGTWHPVGMPSYHAFGACKVVRRRCFEEIGGFIASRGWDTVDEIRAMNRGWTTTHFTELQVRHHKPEGSGIGVLNTSLMHGEIYYLTGGDPFLFMFKAIRRLATPPRPMNALALTAGYLRAALGRKPRLVTLSEAQCYRALLRRRVFTKYGSASR